MSILDGLLGISRPVAAHFVVGKGHGMTSIIGPNTSDRSFGGQNRQNRQVVIHRAIGSTPILGQ